MRHFTKRIDILVFAVLIILLVIDIILRVSYCRSTAIGESELLLEQVIKIDRSEEFEKVFSLIPSHNGITIFASDHQSERILGCTNEELLGKTLSQVGINTPFDHEAHTLYDVTLNGEKSVCQFSVKGDYCYGVVTSYSSMYSSIPRDIIIVVAYLSLAGAALIFFIRQFAMREHRAVKKSRALTDAIGYSFSSYQVISLHTEEVLDYASNPGPVKKLVEDMVQKNNYSRSIREVYAGLIWEDRERVLKKLSIQSVREGIASNNQYTVPHIRHSETGPRHVEIIFSRLSEDYGTDAFILITRNIEPLVKKEIERQNELKEALEKAEVASKSKSNFLFNISHDIRTPMNAVLGFSALAEKHIDNKERALDCLKKLNRAGSHLQRLINRVLNLSRIESNRVELNPQPNNLPSALADAQAIFEAEMQKKRISFTVTHNLSREYYSYDRLTLEQVELNLLSNALKYTPEGGAVSYTVTEISCSGDSSAISFSVKDNGIGMSEEFQGRLFHRFERERTSTEAKDIQGTGLGLSITKSLVEAMGGRITCKSRLGEGTEFTFILPMLHAAPPEDMSVSSSSAPISFEGKKLLLAEDNELNREIATELLSDMGFEITAVCDGGEAVELLSSRHDFDAVLMDIQMPTMDGYTATRVIRAADDKYMRSVPIIAMTANAFEEDKEKALESGMNDHLAKPLDLKKIKNTLNRIINGVH